MLDESGIEHLCKDENKFHHRFFFIKLIVILLVIGSDYFLAIYVAQKDPCCEMCDLKNS